MHTDFEMMYQSLPSHTRSKPGPRAPVATHGSRRPGRGA